MKALLWLFYQCYPTRPSGRTYIFCPNLQKYIFIIVFFAYALLTVVGSVQALHLPPTVQWYACTENR